ncbi:MAG TPA: ABC transporter permease, partial [Stellaceae bacterium]|nr:ABC transporter permease [Stellaceae bacterium]
MSDTLDAAAIALGLVLEPDPGLVGIVVLSLWVSVCATFLASCVGVPLGAALVVYPFPGRRAVIVLLNALLGLPPVVVGLVVYLLLSRAGPLGWLGMLFTPGAMIAAQTILEIPILTVFAHRALIGAWTRYGDALLADGATRARAVPVLAAMNRAGLLT